MSAALREFASLYLTVALLLAVAPPLAWLSLPLLARMGRPLSARQALRVGRGVLVLSLGLPLLATAVHAVMPTGPRFSFERSVARHAGRLPGPLVEPPPVAPSARVAWDMPSLPPVLPAAALALLLGGVAVTAHALVRHRRLLRQLEALPRVRSAGRIAVVLGEGGMPAFSAWFPRGRHRASAWVVVPPALLEDAEGLRLTVLHELQHHRQRDTHWAFARLALTGAFFWHPAAHGLSRWLASLQELACDEALVATGRVQPHAYARCLLQAALAVPSHSSLPAGATGMAHPTTRRIEMLFQPRPVRTQGVTTLLAALCLVLAPLAALSQGVAKGRAVTLVEAQSLARTSQPQGDLPVVVDAHVVARLNALTGTEKGRAFMKRALENLATHRDALAGPLRAKGLPEGLLAVAVVESAATNMSETDGRPSLAPGMRGAGVWMFIPETARRYGLEVSDARDERLDVARETQAAAALLSDLHARFGDWRLALAAYNQGSKKVEAALAAGGSRDATALIEAGHLNDYAATVQAGLLILRNPHLLD